MKIIILLSIVVVSSVANPVTLNGQVELTFTNGVLSCISSLSTSSKITWYRDDKKVSISTDADQLPIMNINKDGGEYRCKVEHQNGSSYSQTLTVKPGKYLELALSDKQPTNISFNTKTNGTQTFSTKCFVSSYPEANITFFHNGNLVAKTERTSIKRTVINDGVLVELAINEVSSADVGEYYCRATNGFLSKRILSGMILFQGACSETDHWTCPYNNICVPKIKCETYGECVLYNCERPSKPNVSVRYIGYDKISIYWGSDQKAKEYTITADTESSLSQIYQTTQNDIIIKDLKNNTGYSLSIFGANHVGASEDENVFFKTKRMVRPQMVQTMTVLRKYQYNGTTGIHFHWQAPKDDGMENTLGELIYKTSYCLYHNDTQQTCKHVVTNATSLDIKNIEEGSLYMLRVIPVNKAGQTGPIRNLYYKAVKSGSTTLVVSRTLLAMVTLTVTKFFRIAG